MYTLEELKSFVVNCRKCPLCRGRTNVYLGKEIQGRYFICRGRAGITRISRDWLCRSAGQLLTKAIEGIGYTRDKVYIANIIKCRPPNNRNPLKDRSQCMYSLSSLAGKIIQPKIIICLGAVAATNIIDPNFKITQERGKWYEKKGIWIMATYHPSAVLRDALKKRPFWEDFKELKKKHEEINKG